MLAKLVLFISLLVVLPACEDESNVTSATAPLAGETLIKIISGSVKISKELQRRLEPSAVLYIVARKPGVTAGPPVAVKRFPQPIYFPVNFMLSAQDAIIPETPFEGPLAITARIAQSGAATPINAGDIEGSAPQTAIAIGTRDVSIELNHVR